VRGRSERRWRLVRARVTAREELTATEGPTTRERVRSEIGEIREREREREKYDFTVKYDCVFREREKYNCVLH